MPHWEMTSFGAVADFINGYPFKPSDWSPFGLPIVRIAQMLNAEAATDHYKGELPIAFRIDNGDLLFSWSATLATEIWNRGPALLNQHLFKVVPKGDNNVRFLHHLIDFHIESLAAQSHGTTMRHIKRGDLLPYPVLMPDAAEQARIAAVLDTVDEAIAKTEAVIAKLRQVRAGLLHDLLTHGLDEYGQLRDPIAHPEQFQDSPLGRIPREWKIVFVDDLCSQVVDCPHSTPTYVLDGIPCIRTADMLPGQLLLNQAYKVTEETYYERTARLVPREGDIIYSREGERLGIASPVGPERVCLGQRVMHLRPKPETDTDYLVWAMNAPLFYRQVLVRIGATTSPHINVGDIRKFSLLRPTPTEQRLIGQTFRACEGLIRTEEAHLAKYQVVKQGLMADLLTGRVRVPESVMAVENQP